MSTSRQNLFVLMLALGLSLAHPGALADDPSKAKKGAAAQLAEAAIVDGVANDALIDALGPTAQTYFGLDLRSPSSWVVATSGLSTGLIFLAQVLFNDRWERERARLARTAALRDIEWRTEVGTRVSGIAAITETANAASQGVAGNSGPPGCFAALWFFGLKPVLGTALTAFGGWGIYRIYRFTQAHGVGLDELKKQIEANRVRPNLKAMDEEDARKILERTRGLIQPHVAGIAKVFQGANLKAIRADLIEEKVARSRGKDVPTNRTEVDAAMKAFNNPDLMRDVIVDSILTVVPTPQEWAGKTLDERIALILARPSTDPMFVSFTSNLMDEMLHRALPAILPRNHVRERVFEATMRGLTREVVGVIKR